MMQRGFITLLLFFCITAHALTLHVSTTKVLLNEAFRITLTTDQSNAEPDITPLQKDFILVGTERSMNYTVMNGKAINQNQWTFLLKPRHIGTLVIPSFAFGSEKTPEQHIEVVQSNLNAHIGERSDKKVRLTAELSQHAPYVNEQVIYTLKLHYQDQLVNAQLAPPQVRDGMMMSLGEPTRYEIEEGGVPSVVEEQKFVIFPQKSGKMTITPARFVGIALSGVPQKIEVQGPKMILDVKPAPLNQTARHWLPARNIQLEAREEPVSTPIHVGDPWVRIVTLKAEGIPSELLPPLQVVQDPHFGTYVDKPRRKNEIQDAALVGYTTTKVTYLFNQAGEMRIPELTLDWFNTKTGQFEKAVLPARTITVAGSTPQTHAALGATRVDLSQSNALQIKTTPQPAPSIFNQNLLMWGLVSFFACGWFVTGLFWLRKIKRERVKASSRKIRQALKKACQKNHAVAAKDCLLAFAKMKWPDATILNLNDVQPLVSDRLALEIKKLSQALYQQSASPWEGEALWQAFLHK